MKKRLIVPILLFISLGLAAALRAQSTPDPTLTPSATPPYSYAIGDSVYVRGGPGEFYIPVGQLLAGDFVKPLSRNAAGDWVLIAYHDAYGWVRRDLASWTEDIDALPVFDESNLTPSPVSTEELGTPFIPTETPVGNWVRADYLGVLVRAGPGRTYLRLGQLSTGDLVEPVGRNEDTSWIMIRYGDGFGWIAWELASWQDNVDNLPVVSADNLTPSATYTATATPTDTDTPLPTDTPTATMTASETTSPTSTATETPIPSATSTFTDTATDTPLPSITPTDTPTNAPTATETDTATSTATATATETPLPTETATDTPTATNTASDTPLPTDTPTDTPSATNTASDTPLPSSTPTNTPLPTDMATSTPQPPTVTPIPPTDTPTNTVAAPTETAAEVVVVVPTLTDTAPPTAPPTAQPTATDTQLPSNTPLPTNTPTVTPTSTATATSTASNTPTVTPLPPSSTPAPPPAAASSTPLPPSSTAAPTVEANGLPTAAVTEAGTASPQPVSGTPASETLAAVIANRSTDVPVSPIAAVPPASVTRFPIEAVVGGIGLLLVLGYAGLYWRGLSSVERYTTGFVIRECPVCHRGHLTVETRREPLVGIPRVRRTVRCDACRSVLRETGYRRWRYAIDPIENSALYERYNGRELDEEALKRLAQEPPPKEPPRPRPPARPPQFLDDGDQ